MVSRLFNHANPFCLGKIHMFLRRKLHPFTGESHHDATPLGDSGLWWVRDAAEVWVSSAARGCRYPKIMMNSHQYSD